MKHDLTALQDRLIEQAADQRAALEVRIRSAEARQQTFGALQAELRANVDEFNKLLSGALRSMTALGDSVKPDPERQLLGQDGDLGKALEGLRERAASLERQLVPGRRHPERAGPAPAGSGPGREPTGGTPPGQHGGFRAGRETGRDDPGTGPRTRALAGGSAPGPRAGTREAASDHGRACRRNREPCGARSTIRAASSPPWRAGSNRAWRRSSLRAAMRSARHGQAPGGQQVDRRRRQRDAAGDGGKDRRHSVGAGREGRSGGRSAAKRA